MQENSGFTDIFKENCIDFCIIVQIFQSFEKWLLRSLERIFKESYESIQSLIQILVRRSEDPLADRAVFGLATM